MPNEWLASAPSPVWEIRDLPLNWNQKMVFQCEFYWVATSLLKARKLLSFFHRAAISQLWLYSPWPPNVMAYLHCQTRTLIPNRIWTPTWLLYCTILKLFPLHKLGLRSQSRSRSPIITVPIFVMDIYSQIGARVVARVSGRRLFLYLFCICFPKMCTILTSDSNYNNSNTLIVAMIITPIH